MSLSTETRQRVQQSLDTLQTNAQTIAERNYAILFEKYPQVQPLFQNSNVEQAKKLAGVIIAFFQNIDHPEKLQAALGQISQRHVQVDVQPGHYAMFGHAFTQALQETLADQLDSETIAAYREAYFYLADQLIERERGLRANQAA